MTLIERMIQEKIQMRLFDPELEFKASKSSGPGGQHVNKVNSRVTLTFDVPNSQVLDDAEKTLLLRKWKVKLTSSGVLNIHAQQNRSQVQNKELAIKKFYEELTRAFKPRKVRKATKPSKAAVKKRLEAKKAHCQKKLFRKKPE
ncbi:alternative ribosome rescue aminoacyl-tRNA hydrolase ArfB [Pararhodonellum marinum]|uniref:alternative ribosome rescue aminoacyl-tRNA hydrolase ArfB n=1 Tax=Pararhodonellum marinum TaxID=2755358 RepID=UPI001E5A281E|nr:alternative ribosome rescue aminoacyl-tRNA hydrolase ArfB [Pararhodonellum marinum]